MTSPSQRSRAVLNVAPSQESPRLRIGDVAARAAVSVDALRFYERRGLLHPIGRRASGYREYDPDTIRLVRFIRRAQALGFTLTEVEDLVRLRERAWVGDAPRKLREAAGAKVADIDHRLRQLRALRGALTKLITACDEACPTGVSIARGECDQPNGGRRRSARSAANGALDCPLIEALDTDGLDLSARGVADQRPEELQPPASGRQAAKRKRTPAHMSVPRTSTRRTS